MPFNKVMFAAAALSMMSWVSTPAFAGHNPLEHGHSHGHGHKAGISGASAEGSHRHGGTKGYGNHLKASDNAHSNEGGATRGLDRADQVAGSHGEEGRENASDHHSGSDHHSNDVNDAGSSHDSDE